MSGFTGMAFFIFDRFLRFSLNHFQKTPSKTSFNNCMDYLVIMFDSVIQLVLQGMFAIGVEGSGPFGIDTSIEGMKSQRFSVGIFYFLVAAIGVFTVFVFMYMFKDRTSKLKSGEKWLFAWILLGIIGAVIFGATQLLHGYLF